MGKPGPDCRVCIHKDRHLIDLGLVHGLSCNLLARRYRIGKDSVKNHRKNHLTPQLRAALLSGQKPSQIDLEQLQRTESEGLLANLVAQRARLQMLSEMAFAEGEIAAAVSVERGITNSLELTSKLLGMIVQRHDVRTTSLLLSPDYLKLRAAIVNALRPHPAAARAVGQALAQLESEAASEIKANAAKGKPLLIEAEANPC